MNPNAAVTAPDRRSRRLLSRAYAQGQTNLPLGTAGFGTSFFRACGRITYFGKIVCKAICSPVEFAREKIGRAIAEAGRRVCQWATENPKLSAAITFVFFVVVPGSIIALFISALLGFLLSLLGFAATGPVAGSAAAWFQATFGNVAARNLFVTLQSAAMGGYGVAVINGVVRVGGAIAGVAFGLWSRGTREQEDNSVTEDGDGDNTD